MIDFWIAIGLPASIAESLISRLTLLVSLAISPKLVLVHFSVLKFVKKANIASFIIFLRSVLVAALVRTPTIFKILLRRVRLAKMVALVAIEVFPLIHRWVISKFGLMMEVFFSIRVLELVTFEVALQALVVHLL